ncbi:hypothetical protein PIIN_10189 [Serendipita indica DSM 11827]|uniref:Uncharacterized protein n=1 Tax=Serendipita indica (strain DSM 11827) TaxID=1109443 RepID=G4TY03_SERID|nr:hypothetical protein PIIN_10189 [Serendipita indica DSM 11827]
MHPSSPCLLVPATSSQPVESYRPSTDTAFGRLLLSKFNNNQGAALESPAAHQLHSIPPRTKTTSGLVVDHLLWLHAQARVASARAAIEKDGPRKRAQAARAGGLHKVIHALTNTSTEKGDKFRLAFGTLVEHLFEPPSTVTKPKRPRTKVNKRSIVPDEICALSATTSPSSQKTFGLGPSWAQPLGIVGAPYHNTPSSPFDAGCPQQDRCIRHFTTGCTLCSPFSPSSSTIGAGLDTLDTSAPLYALRRRSEEYGADQASSSPSLEALAYFLRLSAYILLSMDDESTDLNMETVSASTSTDSLNSTLESGTPHGSSTDISINADMDVDEQAERSYPLRPVDVHQRLRRSFGFQFSFARDKQESTHSQSTTESTRCKPTREWYTLLADLVTRSVLEGYLVCRWKGIEHARVIFGLGSRVPPSPNADKDTKRRSIFSRRSKVDSVPDASQPEHDEDGLPSLTEAAELFFGVGADTGALATYREMMNRRLEEFTTLPSKSPLVKHLESLARKYGFMENAEKCVDKGVVEFCEAVVQWKGLPELEQYKQARTAPASGPTTAANTAATRSSPRMSIAALIHHTSPLPCPQPEPITRFFFVPQVDKKGNETTRGTAPYHTFSLACERGTGYPRRHPGGIRFEREELSAVYGATTAFGAKAMDNTFVLGSKRPREDEDEDQGMPLKKLLVVSTGGFSS